MPFFLRRGFIKCGAILAVSIFGFTFGLCGQSPKRLVDNDIGAALDNARLSMVFQGSTAKDCKLWQSEFKAKLEELLGDSAPPKTWKVTVEEGAKLDDHERHQILLESEGIPSVPVYLLIPKTLPKGEKAPGVLCVHGHGEFGNDPIVGRTDLPGV